MATPDARIANLGPVRVVRASNLAIQVQSKKLGRIWVRRSDLHPLCEVANRRDEGVLRMRADAAKKLFDPSLYELEDRPQ